MDETLVKLVNTLSDQIWFTRKARIRASERLLSNHFHLNLILIWYSFLTFSLSIYLIKDPSIFGSNTDVVMTIATGAVFTLSLFVPQLNLKHRYEELKKNYISMQGLGAELKLCRSEGQVIEIQNRYMNLLHSVENHIPLDMSYFINFEAGSDCSKKLNCYEKIWLYLYIIRRKVTLFSLYLAPTLLIWLI